MPPDRLASYSGQVLHVWRNRTIAAIRPHDRGPTRRPGTTASLAIGTVMFALGKGIPFERIAETTGLTLEQLLDLDGWIGPEVIPGVWRLLAAAFPGEPLGLEMAQVAQETVLGEVGRLGRLAVDLRGSLRLLVRNRALISDAAEVVFHDHRPEAVLTMYHPMGPVEGGYMAELCIGLGARLIRGLFGAPDPVIRIEFAHAPLGALEVYTAWFGVPVAFERPRDGVVLHADALDRPNPAADPALLELLQRRIDRTLDLRNDPGAAEFEERVRRAISENAARSEFGVDALARRLALSPRSLQRHLGELGLSASDLLEEARQARARALLKDARHSVDEVAFLAGYASERSFRRAYARWTGRSPSADRREARGTRTRATRESPPWPASGDARRVDAKES